VRRPQRPVGYQAAALLAPGGPDDAQQGFEPRYLHEERIGGASDHSILLREGDDSRIGPRTRVQVKDECILLAEDNDSDAYLAKLALRAHGLNHDIQVLDDGEAALSFVERLESDHNAPPVALMLLDLHLPKRDGLDILKRLRAGKRGARIPVVILTSSDSPNDRESAEEYERVYFFRKPSSLEEFLLLGAVAKNLLYGQTGNAVAATAATIMDEAHRRNS
jgi:CheY-like chemotaxis protein